TRVLTSSAPVLLLDEPTAHLDATHEATVLKTIRRLADEGRTVVVVGHRRSVLISADTIIEVQARHAR
ncbi:MAG: thiol reductant ABC exporter subunit CydD, partial [Rhodococcus sp. (in: high G+C Gram-positive bacteria)]